MAGPHSPLPWHVDESREDLIRLEDPRSPLAWCIAETAGHAPNDMNGIGNAAFIVRACNAHYQMLEALKAVVRVADRKTAEFDLARAAIAAAEAEAR